MKTISFITIFLIVSLISCRKDTVNKELSLLKISYIELSGDSIPPCLVYNVNEIVITSHSDYDSVKMNYAPRGEWENFRGDGIRKNFKLSYQPLDDDKDGEIGTGDIRISIHNNPYYIIINNIKCKVGNPFFILHDSIYFVYEPPYTKSKNIYYTSVFQVNPITGEVVFKNAPENGTDIWICGVRGLYDSSNGRNCNMDNFNLTNKIIVGKYIEGNCCLQGFDIELLKDSIKREILYKAHVKIKEMESLCPESSSTKYDHWIMVENVDGYYKVVFKQDTTYIN